MTGRFQYGESISYLDSIDIENIGDCCIEAFNDVGEAYYLVVDTQYGMTKVLEYGPFVQDIVPTFCQVKFSQFQYSEFKIDKIIDRFLSSHNITQASEKDVDEIIENLIDPKEYLSVWQ